MLAVTPPDHSSRRLGYTLVCLAIFLVCSQLPLYGVKTTGGSDPFYWARMIMASSRNTVMELGEMCPVLPGQPVGCTA